MHTPPKPPADGSKGKDYKKRLLAAGALLGTAAAAGAGLASQQSREGRSSVSAKDRALADDPQNTTATPSSIPTPAPSRFVTPSAAPQKSLRSLNETSPAPTWQGANSSAPTGSPEVRWVNANQTEGGGNYTAPTNAPTPLVFDSHAPSTSRSPTAPSAAPSGVPHGLQGIDIDNVLVNRKGELVLDVHMADGCPAEMTLHRDRPATIEMSKECRDSCFAPDPHKDHHHVAPHGKPPTPRPHAKVTGKPTPEPTPEPTTKAPHKPPTRKPTPKPHPTHAPVPRTAHPSCPPWYKPAAALAMAASNDGAKEFKVFTGEGKPPAVVSYDPSGKITLSREVALPYAFNGVVCRGFVDIDPVTYGVDLRLTYCPSCGIGDPKKPKPTRPPERPTPKPAKKPSKPPVKTASPTPEPTTDAPTKAKHTRRPTPPTPKPTRVQHTHGPTCGCPNHTPPTGNPTASSKPKR